MQLQKRDILNKLSEYSKEYDAEQIVSAELSIYLEADIKEKEEQLDMWTKKYNQEIVERQQEIDELEVYVGGLIKSNKINNHSYSTVYIFN